MDMKITMLLTAAIFALFVTFIGRYELVVVPAGDAYRLERWTGEVSITFLYIKNIFCQKLEST